MTATRNFYASLNWPLVCHASQALLAPGKSQLLSTRRAEFLRNIDPVRVPKILPAARIDELTESLTAVDNVCIAMLLQPIHIGLRTRNL